MYNDDECLPEVESEIKLVLRDLDITIEHAHALFERLRRRIEPLMGSEISSAAENKEAAAHIPETCELGKTLRKLTLAVEQLCIKEEYTVNCLRI